MKTLLAIRLGQC